jgi:hypothetical protein
MESKLEKDRKKVSKKELRHLLKDSVQQSIVSLELPEPNKKVKKIINQSAKRMASIFARLLKKEFKRSKPNKKAKSDNGQVAQVA